MLHCYIDTDIELKDASNAEYLEAIMDNILEDIRRINNMLSPETKLTAGNRAIMSALESYICHTVTEVLIKFFEKPYNTQPIIDIKVVFSELFLAQRSSQLVLVEQVGLGAIEVFKGFALISVLLT